MIYMTTKYSGVGFMQIFGKDQSVTVDDREVGLFYYRAGYQPSDYPTETEWMAREQIEKTRAAKCPCIADHLVVRRYASFRKSSFW